MAVTFGFYNSQNGDRVYDAVQMSSIFDGLIGNGVYAMIGDLFAVHAVTPASMDITVGTGRAWFNHTWTLNDAALSLTLDTAEVLQDRIDAVVIEINTTARTNSIKVLKGIPSTESPAAPTMNQNKPDAVSGLYQYPLAYIFVGRSQTTGSTVITQGNITNKVGTAECPFVTGVVQVTSLDALLGQWQDQLNQFEASQESAFNIWFADIQQMITSTPSTTWNNLLTEIEAKQDALTFDSTPTSGSSNPVTSDGIASAIANAVDFRISMGTDAPSGGSDGDIYFQYNA